MRYWSYLAAKLAAAGLVLGILLYVVLVHMGVPARRPGTVMVSLPPAMARQMEKAQKEDNRSSSELMSEALRQYFDNRYGSAQAKIQIEEPPASPVPDGGARRVPPPAPSSNEADLRRLLAPLDDGGVRVFGALALMGWFVLCVVALFFIVHDQLYRCRVCLRRLRMPVETGSWSRMLQFGRPRVEYICTYGHGTLRSDEVQISGLATPEWTPQSGDIWDELCGSIVKEDPN
jgi:hypothetical protein